MKEPGRNIIRRSTVELRMSRSLDHEAIQGQVANLFRTHLRDLIGEILDRHTAGRAAFRIETLDLDLGRISLRYLDEELIGKLAEALERELLQHLSREEIEDGPAKAEEGGDFELLAYFLETGALPWWADARSDAQVAETLERVATNRPGDLRRFLRQSAGSPGKLQRLVESLPDHALLRICRLAFPGLAQAVALLLPIMRERLGGSGGGGGKGNTELRQALWQAVFLMAEPKSDRALTDLAGAMLVAWAAKSQGGKKVGSAGTLAAKCLEKRGEMPPAVVEALEKIAENEQVQAPEALRSKLALAGALQELEAVLAEPGMSLERLSRIAPLLREVYHNTEVPRLRALLETLSKFISPYLDPQNNPQKNPQNPSPSQAEAPQSHEPGIAASSEKLENGPMPTLESLRKSLKDLIQQGDLAGIGSEQPGNLDWDMEGRLLRLQAIVQELIQEMAKAANLSKESTKLEAEKVKSALNLRQILPESVMRELLAEGSATNEARTIDLDAETGRQLRQFLKTFRKQRVLEGAKIAGPQLAGMLRIALHNLIQEENGRIFWAGNPDALRALLEPISHFEASSALGKAKSLLEDLRLAWAKSGKEVQLESWEKLNSLLKMAENEANDHAATKAKDELAGLVESLFESLVHGVDSGEEKGISVPFDRLQMLAKKLENAEEPTGNEQEGGVAQISAQGKITARVYAQAVLSFLAVKEEGEKELTGPEGRDLRQKLMELSRILASPWGQVATLERFKPNSSAKSEAAQAWVRAQLGDAKRGWEAARLALPKAARGRFEQLQRGWLSQLKAVFAAEMLQNEEVWRERMADLAKVAERLDEILPEQQSAAGAEVQIQQVVADFRRKVAKLLPEVFVEDESGAKVDGQPVIASGEIDLGHELAILQAMASGLEPFASPAGTAISSGDVAEKSSAIAQFLRYKMIKRKGKKRNSAATHEKGGIPETASTPRSISSQSEALRKVLGRIKQVLDEFGEASTPDLSQQEVLSTHSTQKSEEEKSKPQEALAKAALKEITLLLRTAMPAELRSRLEALRRLLQPGSPTRLKSQNIKALDEIRSGLDHLRAVLNREMGEGAKKASPFTESDALYVGNAGLVLLWPFLGRFFEKLDLMRDRRFVSVAAQQKAVLLLQYIATGPQESGENVFPEYQLPLSKLLCGYPLHQPLPLELELDEATAEECAALIEVVPAHNPKMKNLSTAGFRSAWLEREGVLKAQNENFVLHVERKPYDILLEHLPWSANMVKLQWMEGILLVEW